MRVIKILFKVIVLMICPFNGLACTKSMDFESILNIKSNSKNEYVIHKNIDLEGKTINLPDSHSIVFKGGSINNGTVVLGNDCTIRGNGARIKANCSLIGSQLGHQSIFVADSVKNITIENIVLEGSYNESMGHLDPWSDKSEDSQSLIFIKNSNNISLKKVRIKNFYNSMSMHFSSWDATYKSRWNPFPVNLYGCDSIQIKDCIQEKSCGEAWNIMNCKHITIDHFYCKQKYATSMLSVVYCNNVVIRKSHFESNESLGNLVNIASVNYVVDSNYISGGDLDFGNEHANVNLDLDNDGIVGDNKHYTITGASIRNNIIVNASITNNTDKQVISDYPIEDVSIAQNHIYINITNTESLRAINLGSYGGVRSCIIEDNKIIYNGRYNVSFAKKNEYRYIPIVVYRDAYPVDNLLIRGNIITDNAKWGKDKAKAFEMTKTLGSAILVSVKSGEINVEDNNIKALYGIDINVHSNVVVKSKNNTIKH